MALTTAIAIYVMIWWMTLFTVLPVGVRTQDEDGSIVPGTPGSAPAKPRFLRIVLINTVVATVAFAAFYLTVIYRVVPLEWLLGPDITPAASGGKS